VHCVVVGVGAVVAGVEDAAREEAAIAVAALLAPLVFGVGGPW